MSGLRIANGKLLLSSGKVRQTVAGVAPSPPPAGTGTPATALTVNDYLADRIFQSVGASKDIPVTGTSNGSNVEVRAVDLSGAAITNWTTIPVSGGAYSGALTVPKGGFCKLQARDAVNTALVANGANKFLVGTLIGMIGQSNMVRLSELHGGYPLVDMKTRRFANGAWSFVGNYDLLERNPPNTTVGTYGSAYQFPSPNGDGITYFVNYLRAALGTPVGTFEYAVSGSPLSGWVQGGGQYNTLKDAIIASGGDMEGAIFLQGEQDAVLGTSKAAYKAGVLDMLNGLYSVTGRNSSNFHLGIVLVGPGNGFAPAGRLATIRQAQLELIAENPGIFLCGIATDADLAGDSIHFNTESQIRQGYRYALGMANRLGAVPYGAQGPRITGATRSGATVTVAIAQNGGTLLRDGAGGNGSAATGFRVFNNGTEVTITSKVISGNTVVLSLASVPTGTVTLDYAMADAPFGGTLVPAAALYDNRIVPGDSIGVPLQPCAPITVTGS
jgi:hypothetical protein